MRFFLLICFFSTVFVYGTFPADLDRPTKAYTLSKRIKPLVVLDAGHGGTDEGSKIHSFKEKRITLITTLLVKKQLEEMGYRVILTRSRDVYLPLQERVLIANKNKGSLFVSIHYNAAPSAAAKGIEVFYCNSKEQKWRTNASRRLASTILHHLLDETKASSRGVKQAKHYVTRETDMPAVLIEGGFITNQEERTLLKDRLYLERIAAGIALGVDKYLKL